MMSHPLARRWLAVLAAGLAVAALAMVGGCGTGAAPSTDQRSPAGGTGGTSTSGTGGASVVQPPETTPAAKGNTSPTPSSSATTLADRSVFFAHNSVGQNILDGLRAIDASLTIVSGEQVGAAAFTEWTMGFNGDPVGKLGEFERLMAGGGGAAQIAVFKLCYADFETDTDVTQLFDEYVATFDRLEIAHPDVTFVHVTAPLYAYDASWNNSVQHAFNERLRAEYGGMVFDLAQVEATDAQGQPVWSRDGITPALAEEWSADGSHLNEAGSRQVAAALLAFLSQLP